MEGERVGGEGEDIDLPNVPDQPDNPDIDQDDVPVNAGTCMCTCMLGASKSDSP